MLRETLTWGKTMKRLSWRSLKAARWRFLCE